MHAQSTDPFLAFTQGPIELGRGALLIAQEHNPELDVDRYLSLLDEMAKEFAARPRRDNVRETIALLNSYIFEDLGFRGNKQAYDDPRNSYLDAVIDRRLGIPITLSIVYMEIGKRSGLALSGINFPYHFLVRCEGISEVVFIDPFAGGTCLDIDQLAERLPVVDGAPLRFSSEYIEPATPRDILARMLRNLKRLHVNERRLADAIRCGERIAWLLPDEAENFRDLGFLYYRAHEYRRSIDAFESYLRCAQDPQDDEEIRQNIQVISGRLGMLN